jgi:hypothetical protein
MYFHIADSITVFSFFLLQVPQSSSTIINMFCK